jgi:hypothetical protein
VSAFTCIRDCETSLDFVIQEQCPSQGIVISIFISCTAFPYCQFMSDVRVDLRVMDEPNCVFSNASVNVTC